MATRRDFVQGLALALGGLPQASGRPNPDRPPEAPTGSDVGSLFPFIRSQAVRGEFPLSYLRDEFRDPSAWKRQARGKFRELLHYDPPACDPRPEVVDRADCDGYVRETVHFNTTPDVRVPASVLVPKGLTKPAPAVVALHDHGGMYFWGREKVVDTDHEHPVLAEFKRRYYAGRSIASELARRGYVVIAIDMFYWGERRMLLDGDPADWRDRPPTVTPERVVEFNRRAGQSEPLVGRTIYAAGFTWAGVMFTDDVRTVDYLVTRPEVDPGRVGCVGLSVGGLRSCHLAALDDRVKAAVVVGWMASYPAQLKDHVKNTIGFTKLVPGLMHHLDYPDVASLAIPSALLVINGRRDGLFDLDGVRSSFAKLSACYAKAGVPERFRGRLYDAPHEFNEAMQREAWDWLARWL
jgi:dienelactone hydrolase